MAHNIRSGLKGDFSLNRDPLDAIEDCNAERGVGARHDDRVHWRGILVIPL